MPDSARVRVIAGPSSDVGHFELRMQRLGSRQPMPAYGGPKVMDGLQRTTLQCCVPFCDPSCDGEHHPLLKALFKCAYEPVANTREDDSALSQLEDAVTDARANGWNIDDTVPDRQLPPYPLLHWAALLGKGNALKRLVDIGFQHDSVSRNDGTALHAAILHLRTTYSKCGRGAQGFAAFQKICEFLFRGLIYHEGGQGCTPFNRACELLAKATDPSYVEFYMGVVHFLHKQIRDHLSKEEQKTLVNRPDTDALNTPLHMLAKQDFTVSVVSALLESGAIPTLRNRMGLTACELAQSHGAHAVARKLFNAVPQTGDPSALHVRPMLIQTHSLPREYSTYLF